MAEVGSLITAVIQTVCRRRSVAAWVITRALLSPPARSAAQGSPLWPRLFNPFIPAIQSGPPTALNVLSARPRRETNRCASPTAGRSPVPCPLLSSPVVSQPGSEGTESLWASGANLPRDTALGLWSVWSLDADYRLPARIHASLKGHRPLRGSHSASQSSQRSHVVDETMSRLAPEQCHDL